MATETRRSTILVCDDQPAFREVVSMMLSLEPSLEVVGEATNGEEALRLVAELQPDLVLLDIAMPMMDGLEVLPLIKGVAPDTRVVMLTGFTSTDMRERALAAGARGYIEKGTDVPALVAHIRDLCAVDDQDDASAS